MLCTTKKIALGILIIFSLTFTTFCPILLAQENYTFSSKIPVSQIYFTYPHGLVSDNSGNIFITDQHCVFKLNSNGSIITSWGSIGTANGQFNTPFDIAVNSQGFLYVVDTHNARIQKFDTNGNYVSKWGVPGSGNGQFNVPTGITIDSQDFVYVSDTNNNRIQKFDANGTFITSWGGKGAGNGQFDGPHEICVDNQGFIYVADTFNHRIQKFSSNGTFIATWNDEGSPYGMAFQQGFVYTTIYIPSLNDFRVKKFDTSGNFITQWSGDGRFIDALGITADSQGFVYVSDGGNGRIQKFDTSGNFMGMWGILGSADGWFNEPQAVALDNQGYLYVADKNNSRIQKFDSQGRFIAKWGNSGTTDSRLNSPTGIAVDSQNFVYVIDVNCIKKYDSGGNFITKWNRSADKYPFTGIAVDSQGFIYASEYYKVDVPGFIPISRIIKLDSNLSFITQWGSWGTNAGQFKYPAGIAVDNQNLIYITDVLNSRIQKLNSNGTFINMWGNEGAGDGQFVLPKGIAVDASGAIYVADTGGNRIQKFDANRNFITKWGSQGSGNSQFNEPLGAVVNSQGQVYVVDSKNHRIEKFSSSSTVSEPLYQIAQPYIKYFLDRALDQGSGFAGLTRSFQIDLGGHAPEEQAIINYGAASYDQSILARICLANGTTSILDTYINYSRQLNDPLNPILNCNGNYYDGNYEALKYGPYRIARILGRWSWPDWWSQWDWIVDTGAASCLLVDSLQAYQKTANTDYKDFAILLGDYLLRLQDTDGGIRYGPRGMHHYPEGLSDFYWNLKSTEQNERALSAFEALYTITNDLKYSQAATQLKNWLKGMYDFALHLYHSAATFNGMQWVKTDFSYIATDVMAFAPLEIMFQDSYFGTTQQARDTEVDAMFLAIESKTALFDINGQLKLFRFSISQDPPDPVRGDYGSVEWSAQMALAYLRGAQSYAGRDEMRAQAYLNKYNTLVSSLENYFVTPADDPNAKVAPYASYIDGSVAGGVPTGTGYSTYNCQAALASAFYGFAKAGYDPSKLGGGPGIPQVGSTLNMTSVPWYQNTAYNSTGAAVAQMIINYIREGAGQPLLSQNEIYEYGRLPENLGPELTPQKMDKVLGHFDPYDYLISNWADRYNSYADGNPYKGYNFSVDTYDPNSDPQAINEYMRDICHWMAYTVTKEDWWLDGELVARPNTPAALPIYGTYSHWVVVKGYAASAHPCPTPHTNPHNTPDFTVYGFWIKDPLINGIGKDTYKTADECRSTYFLPLSTGDVYQGKFVQVAEPPPEISRANTKIAKPNKDLANLATITGETQKINAQSLTSSRALSLGTKITTQTNSFLKKRGWKDMVDKHLLSDPEAVAAFNETSMEKPLLVKRTDKKNANYYLLPFGKYSRKGNFSTSAVIILDAQDGHFKEASWSKIPEKFLKIDKNDAIRIIKNYILNDLSKELNKLPKRPQKAYLKQKANLYNKYALLIGYVDKAKTDLFWQPNSYSASVYKPYWKADASGYIFYVTQEGKVIPVLGLKKILQNIGTNRITLERFYWTY